MRGKNFFKEMLRAHGPRIYSWKARAALFTLISQAARFLEMFRFSSFTSVLHFRLRLFARNPSASVFFLCASV